MGVVPARPVVYEVLEDMAITVALSLLETQVPFCAFNGGADVFVDIGNKSLGLHALMKFVGASSEQARPRALARRWDFINSVSAAQKSIVRCCLCAVVRRAHAIGGSVRPYLHGCTCA